MLHMTVRRKIFLFGALFFLALVVVLAAVSRTVIVRDFIKLEQSGIAGGFLPIDNFLSEIQSSLAVKASDWGKWDDSYRFISDRNEQFIESNLSPSILDDLRIDFMVFYNDAVNMVFELHRDLPGSKGESVLASLASFVRGLKKKPAPSSFSSRSGFALLDGKPVIIAICPIITTRGFGPARGDVVFGIYVDDRFIGRLGDVIKRRLELFLFDSGRLPDDVAEVKGVLKAGRKSLFRPVDKEKIAAYLLISDIYGAPFGIVRGMMPRPVYAQGLRTSFMFIVALAFVVAAMGFLAGIVIHSWILKRLESLSEELKRIKTSDKPLRGDLTEGSDEIAMLGRMVNIMLLRIAGADAAIRESEKKYREVVDNVSSCILKVDRGGKFTYWNAYAQHFFGYSEQDILGKSFADTIVPEIETDTGRRLWEMMDDLVEHPDRYASMVNENIKKNGQRVWIAWAHRPMFDGSGDFSGCFSVGNDVTQVRALESELKKTAVEHTQVLDSLEEIVLVYDLSWRVVWVNDRMLKVQQRTLDQIKGRFCHEVWHDSKQRCEGCHIGGDGGLLQPRKFEFSKGGRSFVAVASSLKDDRGRVTGYFESVLDVTEQRQHERSIEELRERYSAFLNSMTDMAFLKDEKFRYVFINKRLADFYGRSIDNFTGKTDFELFPESIAAQYKEVDEQVIRTNDIMVGEEIYKNYSLEVRKFPVRIGDRVGIGGYIRDITLRKRAEQALILAQQRMVNIINSLPEAAFAVDMGGKVMAWNHAMESLTGVSSSEILGKEDHAYSLALYGDVRPMLIDLVLNPDPAFEVRFENLKRSGGEISAELFIPEFRGGPDKYLWGKATVLINEVGKPVGAVETIRDITEIKNQSKTLNRVVALLQATFETSGDGLIVIDRNNRIVQYNEQFVKFWQVPENIIASGDVMQLVEYLKFQLKDSREVVNRLAPVLADFDVHGVEVFALKDGRVLEATYSPHRVEGRTLGRVWSMRDITKRKQYEDTLYNINKLFVSLGPDFLTNIQILTEAGCDLLDGSVSFYVRRDEDGVFRCKAGWKLPMAVEAVVIPENALCAEMIKGVSPSKIRVVKDLPGTPYYALSPILSEVGAKTFFGHAVEIFGKVLGVFCVLYRRNLALEDNSKMVLEIIAKAVGIEEDRRIVGEQLKKRMKELERFNQFAIDRELRMVELKKKMRAVASPGDRPAEKNGPNDNDERTQ